MDFVLALHSLVRWIVLLAAVIAIVKLGLGWMRAGTFDRLDRGVVMGYSGLLDLQALLGFILLFGDGFFLGGGFPMVRILHASVMILAVVSVPLASGGSQAPPVARYRRALA